MASSFDFMGVALSVLATAAVLHSVPARAQATEQSWQELQNEPSRGELFRGSAQVEVKPGVFVFPYSFVFPIHAERDVDGTLRKDSWFGIDISHHNGASFPIDMLRRQRVSFVYTKATQGTSYADKTFGPRWKALKALPLERRLPRGAYHFLSADKAMSGAAQADRFLAYIDLHGGLSEGDLRPAVDLEWDFGCKGCPDRWAARTSEELVRTTLDFVARVKAKTGWTPLVYTNLSFFNDRKLKREQIARITAAAKIWIFNLSRSDLKLEKPNAAQNLPDTLWQFSWGGTLSNGHPGQLDVDVFRGTETEFRSQLLTKN